MNAITLEGEEVDTTNNTARMLIATADLCAFADDGNEAHGTAQVIGGQVYEAHLIADYTSGFDLRVSPTTRIANLEAEVERLRAEVDDLRERLADAGLPSCAREDALEALMEDGAINYWSHDGENTLTVGVSRDREEEVRQALAAVGAREIGESVSPGGLLVLAFTTAGGGK